MKKDKFMKVSVAALAVAMGIGYLRPMTLVTPVHAEEQTTTDSEELIKGWSYLDNDVDPGTAEDLQCWTKVGFDDSSWKKINSNQAFGAKKGAIAALDGGYTPEVLLNQYDESDVNIETFFFRTTVNIENLNDVKSLTGKIIYDDNAVIYINGVKVYECNPTTVEDSVKNSTNMYYSVSHTDAPATETFNIDGDVLSYLKGNNILVEGENVIAIELHNDRVSSSDIYLDVDTFKVNYTEVVEETTQNDVILTMGSDETERNLTWYADVDTAGVVQVAKAGNSDEFPAEYKEFNATSTEANDEGYYTNQATITGLDADTKYVYRLVNGETVSKTYSFETGSTGEFTFALVGDPQIGASGKANIDAENWSSALEYITNQLNPDFMISAGDQVNNYNGSESEYTGYLDETLASLASATTVGNHDNRYVGYGEHFNLPNESTEYGTTTAGGDYWFVYNNTLFMSINSNDASVDEHKTFMQEAIAANPDVTWKTVFFHHSIYSTASHWQDTDILTGRENYPPIFEELGIDVVLMGHDHVYTRSKIMDVGTPTEQGNDAYVVNPDGILYLTANSASGSKYYNLQDGAINAGYAAKYDQSKLRTVTKVTVTENSYTMTTYYAQNGTSNQTNETVETGQIIDTYTIYKTDKTELETAITNAEALLEANYTTTSWSALEEALTAAKEVCADAESLQEAIDDACTKLNNAVEALVKLGDKTELATTIEKAEALKEADYTTESWSKLAEELAAAKEVYDNVDSDQDTIDSAVEALEGAINALEKVEAEDTDNDTNVDTDVKDDDSTDVEDNTNTDTDVEVEDTTKEDSSNDTTTTEKNDTVVETGDATNAAAMGLLMVAAAGTAIIASKKKKESEVK